MKLKGTFFYIVMLAGNIMFSQSYPVFGPEKKVKINGLTFDAMEPFISKDGQTLFFNSLNSGGNTNLYYANRVNDTVFNYVGLVNGCYDPSPNHLDGVPSLDSSNTFYWVSLRNYPSQIENLHKGTYVTGTVNAIKRVYGDFNVISPGWLIMDAAISHGGNLLYFCNAYFNSCAFGMPCKARIGVAQQVNDTTFNKLNLTDTIFSNVNDTNYIVYAPQVTEDGLELYYTRILKPTVNSEICVSVRTSNTDKFSLPSVIHSYLGFVPEAASPSFNKQKLYYHQKESSGLFRIYLRYRMQATAIKEEMIGKKILIYPNPAFDVLTVKWDKNLLNHEFVLRNALGKEVMKGYLNHLENQISIAELAKGVYFLGLKGEQETYLRLIKD